MKYYRRVIRICAEDSPAVRLGLALSRQGLSDDEIAEHPMTLECDARWPGVLTWVEYRQRRATWDKVRQCIGLDGQFWEGAELLMYPPDWLNKSEQLYRDLPLNRAGVNAIGCDPGEGGADSAWAVGDEQGVKRIAARKTPDTTVIPNVSIALMAEWHVPPERFCMDRGGGGKQHADTLRSRGYPIRTVAFGEPLALEPVRRMRQVTERKENIEERYTYKNRRAQMAHELRLLMDPDVGPGYAIPVWANNDRNLRQQLAPIPLWYDDEGRIYLPSKNKKDEKSSKKTLVDIIGYSPDEWDAVMLMTHALLHKGSAKMKAGAV